MPRFLLLACCLPLALAGCASGGAGPSSGVAAEAEWEALRRPRPSALGGAPRLSIGTLEVGEERWGLTTAVPTDVVLQELIGAGLLRRADVVFVERRRFAEAAERERRGLPRPPTAPPVGTSPGANLVLTGTLSPVLGDSARMDLRVVNPETGEYGAAWRIAVPRGADPTTLARRVVGSLVEALRARGVVGAWPDPNPDAAPGTWRPSGVPPAAADAFARGTAAEDAYDWEAARKAYQQARDLGGPGFFEPGEALARVARLRAGGTLGES